MTELLFELSEAGIRWCTPPPDTGQSARTWPDPAEQRNYQRDPSTCPWVDGLITGRRTGESRAAKAGATRHAPPNSGRARRRRTRPARPLLGGASAPGQACRGRWPVKGGCRLSRSDGRPWRRHDCASDLLRRSSGHVTYPELPFLTDGSARPRHAPGAWSRPSTCARAVRAGLDHLSVPAEPGQAAVPDRRESPQGLPPDRGARGLRRRAEQNGYSNLACRRNDGPASADL